MIKYFLILINIIYSIEFEPPYMEQYQLDNGMTILLAPIYDQPIVNMYIIVEAGKINAGENKSEIANLTAQLLKYENQNYTHDELAKYIDDVGPLWTFSSHDYTGFKGPALSEDIEKQISLYSEILRYPNFNKKRFIDRKTELLGWKKLRDEEDPTRQIRFHAINMLTGINLKTFFSNSDMSLDDINNFYNSFYYPKNTKLIISGDFNISYAKILISRYFNDWKETEQIRPTEKYLSKKSDGINVRFIESSNIKRPYIKIVMPGVFAGDVDFISFYLVHSILGRGRNSRFFNSIESISQNWDDFHSGFFWERSVNGVVYGSETSYTDLDKIYYLIKNEIEHIRQNNITKAELQSSKKYDIAHDIISFERPENWSRWVLGELSSGQSLDDIKNWTHNIEAVTLEDVNRTANKYWDHENFYLIVYGNKDSTKAFLKQFDNVEIINHLEINK